MDGHVALRQTIRTLHNPPIAAGLLLWHSPVKPQAHRLPNPWHDSAPVVVRIVESVDMGLQGCTMVNVCQAPHGLPVEACLSIVLCTLSCVSFSLFRASCCHCLFACHDQAFDLSECHFADSIQG